MTEAEFCIECPSCRHLHSDILLETLGRKGGVKRCEQCDAVLLWEKKQVFQTRLASEQEVATR